MAEVLAPDDVEGVAPKTMTRRQGFQLCVTADGFSLLDAARFTLPCQDRMQVGMSDGENSEEPEKGSVVKTPERLRSLHAVLFSPVVEKAGR